MINEIKINGTLCIKTIYDHDCLCDCDYIDGEECDCCPENKKYEITFKQNNDDAASNVVEELKKIRVFESGEPIERQKNSKSETNKQLLENFLQAKEAGELQVDESIDLDSGLVFDDENQENPNKEKIENGLKAIAEFNNLINQKKKTSSKPRKTPDKFSDQKEKNMINEYFDDHEVCDFKKLTKKSFPKTENEAKELGDAFHLDYLKKQYEKLKNKIESNEKEEIENYPLEFYNELQKSTIINDQIEKRKSTQKQLQETGNVGKIFRIIDDKKAELKSLHKVDKIILDTIILNQDEISQKMSLYFIKIKLKLSDLSFYNSITNLIKCDYIINYNEFYRPTKYILEYSKKINFEEYQTFGQRNIVLFPINFSTGQ